MRNYSRVFSREIAVMPAVLNQGVLDKYFKRQLAYATTGKSKLKWQFCKKPSLVSSILGLSAGPECNGCVFYTCNFKSIHFGCCKLHIHVGPAGLIVNPQTHTSYWLPYICRDHLIFPENRTMYYRTLARHAL